MCRRDPAAIFSRRFHEPLPYRLREGTGDMKIECGLVDGVKECADMAEQALRAGAGGEVSGMKIDGAALGQEIAAPRAGDTQRRAAAAEIDNRRLRASKRVAQQRLEIAIVLLRLHDEPAPGTDPDYRRRPAPRRTVGPLLGRDAERCRDGGTHGRSLLDAR